MRGFESLIPSHRIRRLGLSREQIAPKIAPKFWQKTFKKNQKHYTFVHMIAIVEVGNKQYQVKAGDIIDVDHQDVEVGKKIALNVLLTASEDGTSVQVGAPHVEGAKIEGKVLEHYDAEKITVFKMKSKKRYSRTRGFRASRTKIEIGKIA